MKVYQALKEKNKIVGKINELTMKVYQALKEKNKIVDKINELTLLIQNKNSSLKIVDKINELTLLIQNKNSSLNFNIDELLTELNLQKELLISLKTRLYKTNMPIQDKIFKLSELKTEVKFWSGLPTKEGLEYDRYHKDSFEYVSHFNEVFVRKKKEELQKEIEKVQEELDYFNHITDLL